MIKQKTPKNADSVLISAEDDVGVYTGRTFYCVLCDVKMRGKLSF